MASVLDFVLHLDRHLGGLIVQLGPWIYVLLFGILFAETGFVVTPFLPGDTLLFAAGMAAAGVLKDGAGNPVHLSLPILLVVLVLGPLCGDTVNYHLGRWLGPRVFREGSNSRFFKRENLHKTEKFFERYGGKAVVLARWVPIVRTFAPFVAGMGAMPYRKFFVYSFGGAVLWVWVCTLAGYLLGAIPVVQKNFHFAMLLLIVVSLIPIFFEWRKHRAEAAAEAAERAAESKLEA